MGTKENWCLFPALLMIIGTCQDCSATCNYHAGAGGESSVGLLAFKRGFCLHCTSVSTEKGAVSPSPLIIYWRASRNIRVKSFEKHPTKRHAINDRLEPQFWDSSVTHQGVDFSWHRPFLTDSALSTCKAGSLLNFLERLWVISRIDTKSWKKMVTKAWSKQCCFENTCSLLSDPFFSSFWWYLRNSGKKKNPN